MKRFTLLSLLLLVNLPYIISDNRMPPMVAPSHYDTAQAQHFQPPPPPVAGGMSGHPQSFGGQPQGQQYAQAYQQPHAHKQEHSAHVPQTAHAQTQNILHANNMQHEKEHIAEHMEVPLDTSKMSEQELQFHYFKMHDNDNNNKLDGTELIKSLIHWHEQGHHTPEAAQHGQQAPQPKLFTDEELIQLIDPILKMDDTDQDGYISYTEFINAQRKATSM